MNKHQQIIDLICKSGNQQDLAVALKELVPFPLKHLGDVRGYASRVDDATKPSPERDEAEKALEKKFPYIWWDGNSVELWRAFWKLYPVKVNRWGLAAR